MFIKCEKCSRIYEVSDEKLQTLSPRFFKCTACGALFDAPFVQNQKEFLPVVEPAIEKTETTSESKKNVMPLVDIFTPQEQIQSDVYEQENLTNENIENVLLEKADNGAVFEPVKSKKLYFQRWLMGGIAFVLTFVFAFALFYVGRFYFVRKIPFTESLYEKAGISTNITGEGLDFDDTLFELRPDLGKGTLSVKSNLVNTTGKKKTIPNIVVLIKDSEGIELQREYVLMNRSEIQSGEKIEFDALLTDIHPNSAKIEITFEGE